MPNKSLKVTLWCYVRNNGDGSPGLLIFDSEKEANKYADKDGDEYDERFCDDVFSETIEVDAATGKLLTPNPKRKK
jgi:hypothetical protein